MKAWARVQREGVPLDLESLYLIRKYWEGIRLELVRQVDNRFNCYVGTEFDVGRFETLLRKYGISWPRTPKTNKLSLSKEIFSDMVSFYKWLEPLYLLRRTVSDLRFEDLAIDPDGRNRVSFNPMGAISGRCTPSSTKFIYGP